MFLNLIIGCVLGFLTGLGTGGGSLLILWLTVAKGMPPHQARTINLMFFLPCALIAVILNYKKGTLKASVLPILCGCATAAFFSLLSKNTDTEQLKKLFGVLLLILGIKELCYRPRKPK